MGKTYVIDGSNVCWWGSHQKNASISPLLTILIALLEHGDDFYCVFDASIIYNMNEKKADIDGINRMIEHPSGRFFRVTGSTDADSVILADADHHNRSIITNDIYRDCQRKYLWLADKYTDRLIQCNLQPSGLMTIEKLSYGNLHLHLLIDIDAALSRFFELLEVSNAPELTELDKQLQQRRQDLVEIEKRYQQRETQHNQLVTQIDDLEKKFVSLHTVIADLNVKRNQLEADYNQKKNNLAELEQYKAAQAKKVMVEDTIKRELSDDQACIQRAQAAISQFLEPYTHGFSTVVRFEGSTWDIAVKKLTIFFDKNRICTHCYHCNGIWKEECLSCKKGVMTDNPKEIWKIVHSCTPR